MASRAAGSGSRHPASGTAWPRADRGAGRPPTSRSRPRWSSTWLRVPDVERAAVGRNVDRVRAGDAESETLHVATLLQVLELVRIVERAQDPVLRSDDGDIERRGH